MLLENSATSLVMIRFPHHICWDRHLAPIFTPLKWLAVSGSFVILIITMVIALIKVV